MVSTFVFSAKFPRPLRLTGEQTFKYIHRRDAEHAEEAQRNPIDEANGISIALDSVLSPDILSA
jgi:hypothetical protein